MRSESSDLASDKFFTYICTHNNSSFVGSLAYFEEVDIPTVVFLLLSNFNWQYLQVPLTQIRPVAPTMKGNQSLALSTNY